jgi:hypothetical protein
MSESKESSPKKLNRSTAALVGLDSLADVAGHDDVEQLVAVVAVEPAH